MVVADDVCASKHTTRYKLLAEMPKPNWTVFLSEFSTRFCCMGVGTKCLEEIQITSQLSWMVETKMPSASRFWRRRV